MQEMTRRGFLETAGMAAVVPSVGAIAGQAGGSARGSTSIEKNIVYGKAGNTDLHLDIYRPPEGTEKRMAIIHIHGGGFTAGSKDTLADRVAPSVALGYVGIPVQYRLAGEAKWPAQIHDVKAAIRWARANAKSLGVDPEKIAVAGYSAGGHLALFAAGTCNREEFEGKNGTPGVSTQLAACCAYYPCNRSSPTGGRNRKRAAAYRRRRGCASRCVTADLCSEGFSADGDFPRNRGHHNSDREQRTALQTISRGAGSLGIPCLRRRPACVRFESGIREDCSSTLRLLYYRKVLHPRTYPPFGAGGRGRGAQ